MPQRPRRPSITIPRSPSQLRRLEEPARSLILALVLQVRDRRVGRNVSSSTSSTQRLRDPAADTEATARAAARRRTQSPRAARFGGLETFLDGRELGLESGKVCVNKCAIVEREGRGEEGRTYL
jgi:hypothetical protein